MRKAFLHFINYLSNKKNNSPSDIIKEKKIQLIKAKYKVREDIEKIHNIEDYEKYYDQLILKIAYVMNLYRTEQAAKKYRDKVLLIVNDKVKEG